MYYFLYTTITVMVDLHKIYNYSSQNIAPELLKATQNYELVPEKSFLPTDDVVKTVLDFVEEPAPNIISFPFLTPEYCAELIEVCESIGKFSHRPGDKYPAPEIDLKDLSPYTNTAHIQNIEKHILPIATSVWQYPVVWLASAFVVKHSMDGQIGNPGWHHDGMADVSLSVQLNDDFDDGGVYFEKQKFAAGPLPIGHAILFPSSVTHRHTALNITRGTRYSLTYWMKGDIPESLSARMT